jgi:phenylalanyl-tRNA synthetase beta chain
MKFSLSWLKACLDTDATGAQIAATLNAIGLEVEGIEDPAAKLAGFRVARVLTAERHPDADKLQVLSVDVGDGTPLTVVCGAPNARAGLIGVLGLPGAVVPANGMVLKVAAVRGVESNGMMCSTRELELGDDHAGIIELPADAPVGTDFASRLHGRLWHRARSRGGGVGDAEADCGGASAGRVCLPDRNPHRGQ